jgi:hypothetical protein
MPLEAMEDHRRPLAKLARPEAAGKADTDHDEKKGKARSKGGEYKDEDDDDVPDYRDTIEAAASASSSSTIAPTVTEPSVRCFLESKAWRAMLAEGWVCADVSLTDPASASASAAAGAAHAYLGRRCRRFFPRHGLSDGTIVGYLSAQANEGLMLFHCVHTDGDCEDLGERGSE